MHSWTDSKGRDWPLEIHLGFVSALRRRKDYSVNLLDDRSLAEVTSDDLRFADLLRAVWFDRATELGVTEDEFYIELTKSLETAAECFLLELADFFQSRGKAPMAMMLREILQTRSTRLQEFDSKWSPAAVSSVVSTAHETALVEVDLALEKQQRNLRRKKERLAKIRGSEFTS